MEVRFLERLEVVSPRDAENTAGKAGKDVEKMWKRCGKDVENISEVPSWNPCLHFFHFLIFFGSCQKGEIVV
jgi:hypothetical protein